VHHRPARKGAAASAGSAPWRGRVVARFGQRYIVALDAPPETTPGADTVKIAQGNASSAEVDAIGRGRHQDIVVGDRVSCSREPDLYVIEAVEARRNLLFRADDTRTKPLAANVDQVAIVFAAQPPSQPEFLWRALLAARAAGIDALAILNKIDLEGPAAQMAEAALQEVARLGARTLRLSARKDPATARPLLEAQCRGRVTLFVGQSGMGKSSLLNLLIDSDLRIGALSRGGTHGRQTTTATRWFSYGPDGAVIDSPGFHEFGLEHLDSQHLTQWLPDFAAITEPCRFADCRHAEEPDCRIRQALASGAISAERYAFYRKLLAQEPGATVSKAWR
jgi:ribosome biogenesis GTPase